MTTKVRSLISVEAKYSGTRNRNRSLLEGAPEDGGNEAYKNNLG